MNHKALSNVFAQMRYRCNNPNCKAYKWYGAKGIKVKWNSSKDFIDWALSNGYREGLTIDRIDTTGNYEPSNCQWISREDNTVKSAIRGSNNSNVVVSVDEASEMCEAYATGLFTYQEIANHSNCSQPTVSKIISQARKQGADIPLLKSHYDKSIGKSVRNKIII